MERPERIQLHLTLPFKKEPREHPRIGALLDEGFRIDQYQRITDRDVVVTLTRPSAGE
jgi:hypothetical protein